MVLRFVRLAPKRASTGIGDGAATAADFDDGLKL
jgi:hypothetical protein